MRRIIVIAMISMDGVVQAPGGPEEDRSDGFALGGWVAPHSDELSNKVIAELMKPADLLLGRKTFQIWEHYWPHHAAAWPGINEVNKFVLSSTVHNSSWNGSVFINSIDDVQTLKNSEGSDIKVWGSGQMIQSLLQHRLVDDIWLLTYPIILGRGKRLFATNSLPCTFKLIENTVTPKGVIMTHYRWCGDVQTGIAG